jgi:hypothetical protein
MAFDHDNRACRVFVDEGRGEAREVGDVIFV